MRLEQSINIKTVIGQMSINYASTVLYMVTWNGEIIVYDVLNMKIVKSYKEQMRYHHSQLTMDDTVLMVSNYEKGICVYDVQNTFELKLRYQIRIADRGIACGMAADNLNQNVLIAAKGDYYSEHSTDLIVYDIKERKEVRRVPGLSRFPVYVFWADHCTKAIAGTGRSEICCW